MFLLYRCYVHGDLNKGGKKRAVSDLEWKNLGSCLIQNLVRMVATFHWNWPYVNGPMSAQVAHSCDWSNVGWDAIDVFGWSVSSCSVCLFADSMTETLERELTCCRLCRRPELPASHYNKLPEVKAARPCVEMGACAQSPPFGRRSLLEVLLMQWSGPGFCDCFQFLKMFCLFLESWSGGGGVGGGGGCYVWFRPKWRLPVLINMLKNASDASSQRQSVGIWVYCL